MPILVPMCKHTAKQNACSDAGSAPRTIGSSCGGASTVQVHSCKLLLDPMVVANAVRRYETCWLPLVAAHAATRARSLLAPPLDVAWVWLLHALDPVHYAEVQPCSGGARPAVFLGASRCMYTCKA
jgi:hypothetical protein